MTQRSGPLFDQLSDEQLVDLFNSGDDDAFKALQERHWTRVYAICSSLLSDEGGIEDATMDTFIRILEHLGSFDSSRGTFVSWSARIATNVAIDHHRGPQKPLAVDDPEAQAAGQQQVLDWDNIEQQVEKRELTAIVRRCLRRLEAHLRRLLFLRYWQEMTWSEMSTTLDTPAGTIRSRADKAEKRLARCVRRVL